MIIFELFCLTFIIYMLYYNQNLEKGEKMLTQERHNEIIRLLNERSSITVSELSEYLNTSESTIRRDLNSLDDMGKLHKVFGGATSIKQNTVEDVNTMNIKSKLNVKEKNIIGKYAAATINDNDCIYIDAGTTTSIFIDYIENKNATYFTNGVVHAKKLAQRGFKVYVIGGQFKLSTEALIGSESLNFLKKYNFTKCYLGTNGIDKKAGFTTIDIEEALVKTEAINKSYVSFILADHTKFNQVLPVTFGEISKSCIITDKLTNKEYSKLTAIKEVLS